MAAAIHDLPPLAKPAAGPCRTFAMVLGDGFLEWGILCAYSLARVVDEAEFEITPDGGLGHATRAALGRLLPGRCRFVDPGDVAGRVESALPRARFPRLRASRDVQIHLAKLVDVYAGRAGRIVALDADLVFYRRPGELLGVLDGKPKAEPYLIERRESYAVFHGELERLSGHPVPRRYNSGITAFHAGTIDWERVERWLQAIWLLRPKPPLEHQTLCALLASELPRHALAAEAYLCRPNAREIAQPQAVLHHYNGEYKARFHAFANIPRAFPKALTHG
ncbi:MAG: hypothetical protein RLY93_00975 [Sumerlaeia bacterium]